MTPTLGQNPAPERSGGTIGWFTASCLIVSNMIGGGIFTTTGLMAREVADPLLILLLWCVGGLFAIGGAMVYGELGSRLPHAGGDYVYLREAYGSLVAFLSGWTSFTIGFGAAVAASAISFSSYAMQVILIEGESGWWTTGLSLGLLWMVTLVHCRGLGTGGWFQRSITSLKILSIGALIIGGMFAVAGHWDSLSVRPEAPRPTLGAVATSLVIVTYCYLGWNVAGFIAAEISDPRRTLPRVMIGATVLVSLIYVLLNVVYLSALSISTLAQDPIIPVAEKTATALWGPHGGRLAALILCLSIAGAISAMTWAGPRVYWAMAHDGVISPWLAGIHPSSGVPARAIIFQSLWASLLIITGTFEQLVVYSGLVLSLFMALTLSTIFRLRTARSDDLPSYHTPYYPLLPTVLVMGPVALVAYTVIHRPTEFLYGVATVLSGIPLYILWRKSRQL